MLTISDLWSFSKNNRGKGVMTTTS